MSLMNIYRLELSTLVKTVGMIAMKYRVNVIGVGMLDGVVGKKAFNAVIKGMFSSRFYFITSNAVIF